MRSGTSTEPCSTTSTQSTKSSTRRCRLPSRSSTRWTPWCAVCPRTLPARWWLVAHILYDFQNKMLFSLWRSWSHTDVSVPSLRSLCVPFDSSLTLPVPESLQRCQIYPTTSQDYSCMKAILISFAYLCIYCFWSRVFSLLFSDIPAKETLPPVLHIKINVLITRRTAQPLKTAV